MTVISFSLRNRILISRIVAATLFLLLGFSADGWDQDAPLLDLLLSLVGWVLISIGVSGRIWCSSYISGYKNTNLITDGPYSICRNPLYFFSFVGGLGITLVTDTLLLPLLFILLFLPYYSRVMAREESTLRGLHADSFEAYFARVPRFWPNIGLYVEPEHYLVSALQFRKSLADAVWWIIWAAVIEFLEGMHAANYLPTLLHIY